MQTEWWHFQHTLLFTASVFTAFQLTAEHNTSKNHNRTQFSVFMCSVIPDAAQVRPPPPAAAAQTTPRHTCVSLRSENHKNCVIVLVRKTKIIL